MSLFNKIKTILDKKTGDSVSADYQILNNPDLNELRNKYDNAWKDENIPEKQLKRVQGQIKDYRKIPAMNDLVKMVGAIRLINPSVLEIGCSSGYYSEIFERAGINVQYEGCDYSSKFIKLARKLYPRVKFKIEDATSLDYQDNSFDIVISGCCILHILDYQKAIKESARVARDFVIFHRTPVVHLSKTVFTQKVGYGVDMIEIFFNETELLNLFHRNNLYVKDIKTHDQFAVKGLDESVFMKNYLLEKDA